MRSCKDGSHVGGGGGVQTGFGRRRGFFVEMRKSACEKAFARNPGEDGQVKLPKLIEMSEQGIVFVEPFPEAEAGIENDFIAGDSSSSCGVDAFSKAGEDKGKDFVWREWRESGPVLRAAPSMHQDGAAAQPGAGFGHGGIP